MSIPRNKFQYLISDYLSFKCFTFTAVGFLISKVGKRVVEGVGVTCLLSEAGDTHSSTETH